MSTWGQFSWGDNSWSSDQNNISLSGISLSTNLGSPVVTSSNGWGNKTWSAGEWGDLSNSISIISGEELNISLSSVIADGTINIGWGGLAWNEGEWGDLANPNLDVTGQQLNTSLEDVTASAGALVSVTGEELNSTTDSVLAGTSAVATPSSPSPIANTSVNDVFGGETNVVQVTSPSNDEWGTELWGSGQWGVGDGITIFVGTETEHIADGNVEVTGNQIDFEAVGTVEIPVVVEGIQIASSVNDVFGGEVVEVQVTTASATNWGDAPFGAGQFGQGPGTDISQGGEEIGLPSQEVPVTNTNLTLNSFANNQPTITADANVPVTGQEITTVLGNEDAIPNTIASPTGIELTTSIGTAVAGASAEVDLTGVTMTSSSGTIGLNAWELVDPGTAPTWTVVDKAA